MIKVRLQWQRKERMLPSDPAGYPTPGTRFTDRRSGDEVIVLPWPNKYVPSTQVAIKWEASGVTNVIDRQRLVEREVERDEKR